MTGVVQRFEARVPSAPGEPPVPWIVSNPLYFSPPAPSFRRRSRQAGRLLHLCRPPRGMWKRIRETEATTTGAGEDVVLDYRLASGSRRSQFAAAVTDLQTVNSGATAIAPSIAAAHPARVSAQLRYPDRGGVRWAKSVYVDTERRERRIPIERMVPADFQPGHAPDPSTARPLLFVVDLTNARPGTRTQSRSAGSVSPHPPPVPRFPSVNFRGSTSFAQCPAARQSDRSPAGRAESLPAACVQQSAARSPRTDRGSVASLAARRTCQALF